MSLKIFLTVAFLAGCGPAANTVVEKVQGPPTHDTTLGIGDTFDVRVLGETDLAGTYRVGAEGVVSFPLVGDVKVVGLTPEQAAEAIAVKLRDGFIKNPQVSVLTKETPSKKVYVLGQVQKPGTYTYAPSMSVVEAVTVAGGFTPIAAKNYTTLTRQENGKKVIVRIPIDDITAGKTKNVYLQPGDILTIPETIL
jgi:polysaccharide export outer membrane protein